MPLIALWKSNPSAVDEFTIEQVVSSAGNGELKDASLCSSELREFFAQIPTSKIGQFVQQCLSKSFPRGGMVLQDLVNELGRRLDYSVENGRYQGVSTAVGFDGIWASPEGHSIIVEVKTTDVYRISLDTIAGYRDKLRKSGNLPGPCSALIIVGRDDTGELEAQVRGSRHAWDIRLISSEALLKLVQLKENADELETGLKIRSLLTPMEYTRLDRIIDVMFTTVNDVEPSLRTDGVETEESLGNNGNLAITRQSPNDEAGGAGKGAWVFTDSALLQQKRATIIAAVGREVSSPLIKRTRSLYWSKDHETRVACAISKRYTKRGAHSYWYAYHPRWDDFLRAGDTSLYVLGCMDQPFAYAIPRDELNAILPALYTTTTDKGSYWHVHLTGDGSGGFSLLMPKEGSSLSLARFRVGLSHSRD